MGSALMKKVSRNVTLDKCGVNSNYQVGARRDKAYFLVSKTLSVAFVTPIIRYFEVKGAKE